MMEPKTILVTGANGFVGRSLRQRLAENGFRVRCAVRSPDRLPFPLEGSSDSMEWVEVGDIGPETDWDQALGKVNAVIHLAARVHVMREKEADPLKAFSRVNREGTEWLARSAARRGVKRFIFLSTIKVNGEKTEGKPFTEEDPPMPEDPYAVSKLKAERGLRRISEETGLETVIVRPPLIYGPGVKGNFINLIKLVDRALPLPLASVNNRRSLLGLENLTDLLVRVLDHPAAAGNVYLASDGPGLSTPDLIRALAAALGRPARLWPFPVAVLSAAAAVLGKSAQTDRLCRYSLELDDSRARNELGWNPPSTLEQGLTATAKWYRDVSGGTE